jgi:hypothetical protein
VTTSRENPPYFWEARTIVVTRGDSDERHAVDRLLDGFDRVRPCGLLVLDVSKLEGIREGHGLARYSTCNRNPFCLIAAIADLRCSTQTVAPAIAEGDLVAATHD